MLKSVAKLAHVNVFRAVSIEAAEGGKDVITTTHVSLQLSVKLAELVELN